jgi:arylformamidase
MKIYDVTVPIRSGMPIYEGDPGVEIKAWSALAKGDSANVSFLNLGAHTGTHVDAPAHFIEGARKIDALSVETLIGGARVVRVPDEMTEIDPDFLAGCDLDRVERVLFHTRNSSFWNEGFRKDFTHLLPEAAEKLIEMRVKLVGTDYLSIEKFHSGGHRTHLALLSNNVVIVEGAGDGAPARVVLRTL